MHDEHSDRRKEIRRAVRLERERARQSVRPGMYANRRDFGSRVVVIEIVNDRVLWQNPSGPGFADRHRDMDIEDFDMVYGRLVDGHVLPYEGTREEPSDPGI